MPIRNTFKYKDIVAVLKHYKCHYLRDWKGSHENRYSANTNKEFTIPNHWPKELKIWTLFSILHDAGISKQEVKDYLNKKW